VPDWRPDGERIVFTSKLDVANSDIYTIHPDGHSLRRLTRGPADDFDAAYSPRGGRLVFASTRGTGPENHPNIWIMHGDGTRLRRVITHDAVDVAPDWGPHQK